MRKIRIKILVLMLPLLFAISCTKCSDSEESKDDTFKTANDYSSLPFDPSDPNATVAVKIYVTDASYQAIAGAKLAVNGTTYTLSAGSTEQTITGISVKEAPHLLVQAPGYMTKYVTIAPMDSKAGIEVILQPMETNASITNSAGGNVLAKAGSVTLAGDALLNQDGSVYTGTADVGLRISDVNRDHLDRDGKVEVSADDVTMLTKDSSGTIKMAMQLATMQVQAKDGSGNDLKLDPTKPAAVSMHIDDRILALLNGTSRAFGPGSTLPLVSKNETTGQWDKTGNTCTLVNNAGKTYCQGTVDTLKPVAVSYESKISCIKAELGFSIPKEKSVTWRKYSISAGYKLHVYAAKDGKVGLVAVVPSDSTSSYNILSEYNLQTTREMTDPVDPFAGANYSQLDTVPVQTTSAVLTGNESSSLDAALAVCSMDATSITVTAPQDTTIDPVENSETADASTVFLAPPVFEAFIGTWSTGCENDGSNDSRVVQTIDSANQMSSSWILYSSNDSSCDPTTKMYEYKSNATISDGNPSGIFESGIEAVKMNTLVSYESLTLLSDNMVTEYNNNSFYGISDWAKDVERDITGKNSDGTAKTYSTYYDLAWVSAAGDIAYSGLADATYDGSTEAKRPVSLHTTYPIYRQ